MDKRDSKPLRVGVGEPVTALGLLQEMRPSFERYRAQYAVAERNERFLNGRQWVGIGANDEVVPTQLLPWEPMVTKNLLRPLWHTWASRILKGGVTSRAFASDASPGDLARAFVANTILDYQRQTQDRDALHMEAALLAQAHGSVALLTTWDPQKGKHKALAQAGDEFGFPAHDEAGEPIMEETEDAGDCHVEVLTIFDYATDGAEHVEDSDWLIVRRYLSRYDAEARMREAGHTWQVSLAERRDHAERGDTELKGVECFELWHRATPRFPEGLYCSFVGECVVECQEHYPYAHGELPLAVWKIQDKRGSPFGETHVTDAVPQQQRLNEILAALARWTDIVRSMRMISRSAIADQWDTEPDGIIKYDGEGIDKVALFVTPPAIPKDLYELADRYEAGIAQCFGVSETIASGGAPSETKSARQLAYMSELDGQKLAVAKRNLDKTMLRVDRQTLKLWQQFVHLPRLVRVIGADHAADADFFNGADIAGVDVWLEPAPSSDRSRASTGLDAEQAAAAGYLGADKAGERRETGLAETAGDALARADVARLVQRALQGEAVQADPAHDPTVAISVVRQGVEHAIGTPTEAALRALLAQYVDLQKQAAAETGAPPKGATAPQQDQMPTLGGLSQ